MCVRRNPYGVHVDRRLIETKFSLGYAAYASFVRKISEWVTPFNAGAVLLSSERPNYNNNSKLPWFGHAAA